MKRNIWKRVAAIGVASGMLITSMPVMAFDDEMIVEDDSYIIAEDETETVITSETDDADEIVFDDSYIIEELDEDNEGMPGIASEETEEELQVAASTETSGTCGDNLTWVLDSNGVLTISGTGDMTDYSYNDSEASPFKSRTDIKTICIEDSVTSIGDVAFYHCNSLTSITIPSSVTSIGDGAIEDCSSLTSITIPSSVTSIGFNAFRDCSSLTNITIPNSVTSIGNFAFSSCKSLASITIPSGVTRIGNNTFMSCSSLTSITIPDGVTSIEQNAFCYCSSLTNITIPSSVTSIGVNAFFCCSSLTNITIPSSVTSIGFNAFRDCSGMTSINVDKSNSVYDSRNNCNAIIETSSNKLIYGCKNTVIPSSVTSIGTGAFDGCSSLTSITIPSSVTSIGGCAFENCSSLTSITIPSSVTSIEYRTFMDCSSLTSITIPSSVTSIGFNAFYSCKSLASITIPDSVTSIGDAVFDNCDNLTIYGYTGSYAETYAVENNIPFVALEEESNTIIETGPGVSDITYLAMSDAAYVEFWLKLPDDYEYGEALGKRARNLIKRKKKFDCNDILQNSSLTWNDLYEQCLSTWSVEKIYENPSSGFYAVVFKRDNDVVVAFRGSQSLTSMSAIATDWSDDVSMGLIQEECAQLDDAVEYMRRVVRDYPDANISCTGHSLGGGLGIIAANAYHRKAVVFDSAPSLTTGYYCMWRYMSKEFRGIDEWTYTDYMDEFCPVGGIERSIKNCKLLKSHYSGLNRFLHHARDTIVEYDTSAKQFKLSSPVSTNSYGTNSAWVKDVDHLQLREIINSIQGLTSLFDKAISVSTNRNIIVSILNGVAVFDALTSAGTLRMGTSVSNNISGTPFYLHTDVIYGGSGDDNLTGYAGDDYLIGGNGGDRLDGGRGNDTYIIYKGQGCDYITDVAGNDTILLYGYSTADNIAYSSSSDGTVSITGGGETIARIKKSRSINPFNSFDVYVMDASGEVLDTKRIQDWNKWNYLSYCIACPVDVNVYDSEGTLVAILEDGVETTRYEDFGNMYCVYNEGTGEYEKLLDIREDYSVVAVGTNTGRMNVSVTETDGAGADQNYSASAIPVVTGQEFTIDGEKKSVETNGTVIPLVLEGSQPVAPQPAPTPVITQPTAPSIPAEQITISKKPTIKKPSATKNKITVSWKHFKQTKKTKKVWKKIKKVQIQCATDKAFTNIIKTSMVGKKKTKATIKGLSKKTTYYVRVRYYDGTGYSKWSSVKKVKTKK